MPESAPESAPDVRVVSQLLSEQVPAFAAEPVRASEATGSSNWVFRVGERHAVRLPRSDEYAEDLLKEARWVPRLAPNLPLPVPDVVHCGEPSSTFQRPWTVVTWVPGERPGTLKPAGQDRFAQGLGAFLRSLHAVDLEGEIPGAERWGYRCGEPVTDRMDVWAQTAAAGLAHLFDPTQVLRAWEMLREVPPPSMSPCWVHTDLSAENLLTDADGNLVGVIDFGGLGVGDPSIDLLYGWGMFEAPARATFRAHSGVDDGTWLRGRAWAFVGPGLLTLLHYEDSMPERTARLATMVEAVAHDVGVSLG